MAYAGSKAISGNQTVISINGTAAGGVFTPGTASTPVWTPIGEIGNFVQSGTQNKTDDTTNLQSSAEEFIPTILTPGKVTGAFNRVSGDAGQSAVKACFYSVPPVMAQYKAQLPKSVGYTSTGDSVVFTALVEELGDLGDIKPDKKISSPFAFKISGALVWTTGS